MLMAKEHDTKYIVYISKRNTYHSWLASYKDVLYHCFIDVATSQTPTETDFIDCKCHNAENWTNTVTPAGHHRNGRADGARETTGNNTRA